MIDLNSLTLRQKQLESARVISIIQATNNDISQFNQKAHHDSQAWYCAVIQWYIDEYGDLPSKTGPVKDVKLISNA
jgi:hypothetical protein